MRSLVMIALFGALLGCSAPSSFSDREPPAIDPALVVDAVPRPDPILEAGNKSPYIVAGESYRVLPSATGYREQGIASWYGLKFHGRKTSNGERFSVYEATAAHKTLPIPSYVRVTNKSNQRSIVVRVNDRGPFHADRIIDLSYGAALKLGYAEAGTTEVFVEAITVAGVEDRRGTVLGQYRQLQLGAFGQRSAAESLAAKVAAVVDAPTAITEVSTQAGRVFRLRLGPFASESLLRTAQQRLRDAGFSPGQALP